MVSKEKKREYNIKYREAKKREMEEAMEEQQKKMVEIETQTEEHIKEPEELLEVMDESKNDVQEGEEEEVVISRATLDYLLSKVKEKEETNSNEKEEKKVIQKVSQSNNNDGFFFQLKTQMKNQMIASVGAMLPIIGMKMIMNGVEYLKTSPKQSPQVTKDIKKSQEQFIQPLSMSEIQPFRCA